MIGVIPKAGQREIVEEFFELFKTPWEWYVPGRTYDIVIATADEFDEIGARVLLVYGPDPKNIDLSLKVTVNRRHEETMLKYREAFVPVYRGSLTFSTACPSTDLLKANLDVAALKIALPRQTVFRVGFDIFEEVRYLLSTGQPTKNAQIPTLDMHIEMLRQWILETGTGFIEIPPTPEGYRFCVSLTHDIDFVGIRNHKFDHTMWGFLYRSTVGAVRNFLRGRLSLGQVMKCWRAVISLPGVFLGWVEDFWEPFAWYLEVEKNLPATYFLIPFPGRAGDKVSARHAARRAAKYEVKGLSKRIHTLMKEGCEIGVHGIDSWHSEEHGREELQRIADITDQSSVGIRMHWLLRSGETFRVLENAGYVYDSTVGYNDTIGYRSGTTQCFCPLEARQLVELPLHIQDGALFYPQNLDLPQSEAWKRCEALTNHALRFGGVLTVLWHDRSHAPERFWGDFYKKLVDALRSSQAWFGSALQVVTWFRRRREIKFEHAREANAPSLRLSYSGKEIVPPLTIRIHRSLGVAEPGSLSEAVPRFRDISWNGASCDEVNGLIENAFPGFTKAQNGTACDSVLAGSLQ